MLEFPKEFFEGETIEDFYVDATMKRFWAAEMEVLREIAEICERHGLTWYAAYGTLLGAVRHEGFIPWDDDMDIWMKREDFQKFLEVAPKELPTGYLVHSSLTELGYLQFHSCVLNAGSVSVEPGRLQAFHGCPFVVGVDIFPLDYLPDDEKEDSRERELFDVVSTAATMVNKEERSPENFLKLQKALEYLEKTRGVSLPEELLLPKNKEGLVSALQRLGNEIAAEYGRQPTDRLAMYMDYINWPWKVYRAEWFGEPLYALFEGLWIPVPPGYQEILRVIYGDYEKRVRRSSMHGYPMYQKQLEQMKNILRKMEEQAAAEKGGSAQEENLPILILYPDDTCYGVLADFADKLQRELEKQGERVISAKRDRAYLKKAGLFETSWKAIIGFQSPLLEKEALQKVKGQKLQFWFDNPLFFDFFQTGSGVRYLCQDADYAEYLQKYYQKENALQFPPAGTDAGLEQNERREYDLVFVGSYEPPSGKESRSSLQQGFFEFMLAHKKMTFEEGLISYLQLAKEQLAEKSFRELAKPYLGVCRDVIRENRRNIIESILQAGISIHVFGDSWRKYQSPCRDALVIHKAVSVEESLQIMGHAKIGLNIMSWHKSGMTERVANILLSGALCLSDETAYLQEHFTDGEELVLFSLTETEKLPGKIRYLLEHGEVRSRIARAGCEKAKREHTWACRTEELLKLIEQAETKRKK